MMTSHENALLVRTRHVTEYVRAKTRGYLSDAPQFPDPTCCEKYLKDDKHNSPNSTLKFPMIIFEDNYLSVFSRQIVALSDMQISYEMVSK